MAGPSVACVDCDPLAIFDIQFLGTYSKIVLRLCSCPSDASEEVFFGMFLWRHRPSRPDV